MDKRQRIQAALQKKAVDRVPLSLWRHFHREDRSARDLATATLSLARKYDLDLVKLTPCGLYAIEDWAGSDITYPGTDHEPPYLLNPALTQPEDWGRLSVLEPATGALGRELEAIRIATASLKHNTPCLMTIFSPLTLAFKLAGKGVVDHLRQHPTALHTGLEIIAQTTAHFGQAALNSGADGLFFATQLANHHMLTPTEYDEFGLRYDLAVLDALSGRSAITVLHLHGTDIFFDLVNRYPVHAVSWHDQETFPDLVEAQQLTDRAFVTGLDRNLLLQGPLTAIEGQVRQALAQTEERGLILAPSCVIPTSVPDEHLRAVRECLAVR
jgi:uroporphyrinogen decarboxylase